MQSVSNTWKANALLDETLYDVTITVGGTAYTAFSKPPVIHRVGVPDGLFGAALSSSLEFSIIPAGTIPKAAACVVTVAAGIESINLGTFYINTREPDKKTGITKFECFDTMRKGDVPFYDNQGTYPMSSSSAVAVIAGVLGVQTVNCSNLAGQIDTPVGVYTYRETLAYIAAMNGGNFVMDEDNKLKFVPLATPGTAVTSCMAASIEMGGDPVEVSKVMLFVDSGVYVQAGTDLGDTLSADCPFGNLGGANYANAALNAIGGVEYYPYAADTAPLDPAVQIGDTVTVSHQTFNLYNYDLVLGRRPYFKIQNPGKSELEQEYIFADPDTRAIDRTVARSYSEIKKTTDEISLSVVAIQNELDSTVKLTASAYEFIKGEGETSFSPSSITVADSNAKETGTYAWYIDGTQVSGATDSAISIPNSQRSTAGSIVVRCVWTDSNNTDYADETSIVWITGGQDGETFAWNLMHNTLNPSVADTDARPNINGYTSAYAYTTTGTVTTAEHGIKVTNTGNTRTMIRFGSGTFSSGALYGLVPGKTYTLSFDASWKTLSGYTGSTTGYMRATLSYGTSSGTSWVTGQIYKNFATITSANRGTDMTGRCEFTFTVPSNATKLYIAIVNSMTTASYFPAGDYIEIRNVMLNEGSAASPWSPCYDEITGADGYTIVLTNEYVEIPVDAARKPLAVNSYACSTHVYKGTTLLTPTTSTLAEGEYLVVGAATAPTGMTVTQSPAGTFTFTTQANTVVSDAEDYEITITPFGGQALTARVHFSANMNTEVASQKAEIDIQSDKIAIVVSGSGTSADPYKANAASIVTAINDSGSSVAIEADKIEMTGTTKFLTPADVGANGSTVIDGGRISTNSITADKLNVGTIEAGKIASGTVEISSNATYGPVGTIYSSRDQYGYAQALRIKSNGSFSLNTGGTQYDAFNLSLQSDYGQVYLTSGYGLIRCQGTVYPSVSGYYDLGDSSYRWDNVYANTGAFTSSDRDLKKDIENLPQEYESLFDRLRPVRFRYKDGKRFHTGMISQEVEESMTEAGLSDMDFAGFGKDQTEVGEIYSLRYEEFISLCIDQIQKLKARVDALEQQIEGGATP